MGSQYTLKIYYFLFTWIFRGLLHEGEESGKERERDDWGEISETCGVCCFVEHCFGRSNFLYIKTISLKNRFYQFDIYTCNFN